MMAELIETLIRELVAVNGCGTHHRMLFPDPATVMGSRRQLLESKVRNEIAYVYRESTEGNPSHSTPGRCCLG